MSDIENVMNELFYKGSWSRFVSRYKPILQEVISKVYEQRDYYERNRHNEVIKYIDNLSDTPLSKHLEILSFEDIKVIKAVMYIGRDKDHKQYESPQTILNNKFDDLDLINHASKNIAIDMIMEKKPLKDYILDGMEILKMI